MSLTARRSHEQGFTLLELLITLAITGIVVVAVGGMLTTVFLSSTAAAARESHSHEAQNAAAYFAQDVQSVGVRNWSNDSRPLMQSVELNAPTGSGLFPCGSAGTPNAVIRMAWDDFDPALPSTPKLDVVAYVVEPSGVVGISQLHRLVCQDGALLSDRTIVRELGSAPVVACLPGACTDSTPLPTSISLTIVVHDPRNADPDLTVVLQGHRRQTCRTSEDAQCSA